MTPKDKPFIVARMEICIDSVGNVNFNGPVDNKAMCKALLAAADVLVENGTTIKIERKDWGSN